MIEEGGLLLEEGLDFGVVEAEAHQLLEGVVHDLRTALHPFAFRERSAFLNRVSTSYARTQQALFFEFLVRLPDGVE